MGVRFPLFIDLDMKKILVVGAGRVALRRIQTLLMFSPFLHVVAKDISEECKEQLEQLVDSGAVYFQQKPFEEADVGDDLVFVLAATDDVDVNRTVYDVCKRKEILVNVASDQALCDFYFPAVIQDKENIIGITGDGTSHSGVAKAALEIKYWLEKKRDEN